MKALKQITIIILLVLIGCSTATEKKTTLTEIESNAVIGKWLNLWETYDVNKLGDVFLESDKLTYFSSEKRGLIKGYDKMKPHHIGFGFVEGGKKPAKSLWLENIETRVYDGSTMVGGVWYFGDKSLPKDSISNGPVTFIIVKDKQGLAKIIHTHFANY